MYALEWIALPVAVVWLLLLGAWWTLAVALAGFAAPLLLGVGMLPGLAIAVMATRVVAKQRRLGITISLLGMLYVAGLITVWCMGVFTFLANRASADTLLPMLLLAFAVGTGPWRFMARRELREGRMAEVIQTFFLQCALLAVIITFLVSRPSSYASLWWLFSGVMLLQVVVYAWSARDSQVVGAVQPEPPTQ